MPKPSELCEYSIHEVMQDCHHQQLGLRLSGKNFTIKSRSARLGIGSRLGAQHLPASVINNPEVYIRTYNVKIDSCMCLGLHIHVSRRVFIRIYVFTDWKRVLFTALLNPRLEQEEGGCEKLGCSNMTPIQNPV